MRRKSIRKYLGITLDSQQIRKLLEFGREDDINRGGYCDARSGVVNFWCGPENKPICWGEPTQGALDYPRDYVGGLYWTLDDTNTGLCIDLTPYALLDSTTNELSDETWEQCMEWCVSEARKLLSKIGVELA